MIVINITIFKELIWQFNLPWMPQSKENYDQTERHIHVFTPCLWLMPTMMMTIKIKRRCGVVVTERKQHQKGFEASSLS